MNSIAKSIMCAVMVFSLVTGAPAQAAEIDYQGSELHVTDCNSSPCLTFITRGSISDDGRYYFTSLRRYISVKSGNPHFESSVVRIEIATRKTLTLVDAVDCPAFPEPMTVGATQICSEISQVKLSPNGKELVYHQMQETKKISTTHVDVSPETETISSAERLFTLTLSNKIKVDLTSKYGLKGNGFSAYWHANSNGVFVTYNPSTTSVNRNRYIDLKTGKIVSKKDTDFYVSMSPNGKYGVTLANSWTNDLEIKTVASGRSKAFLDVDCHNECVIFNDGSILGNSESVFGKVYAKQNGVRIAQTQLSLSGAGNWTVTSSNIAFSEGGYGQTLIAFKIKTS